MSEISKPDYRNIWASGGAIVSPSNTKWATGWTAEVPPYQWENSIQNRQDVMLAHINQHGIPQWDALTEYFAGKSYCLGSDGQVYKAVASSSPATTTQDPTTDASDTYWRVAFADAGVNYLTQATGDARYAQRANNLSDLSNAATARTNLGVVAATETVAGLAEIATQAEVNAGTDNVRYVTPLKLASFSNATQAVYISNNLTVVAGAQTVLPHGLGRQPSIFQVDLVCVSAQLGWSAGDVLFNATTIRQDVTAGATGRGYYVYDVNTTTLTLGTGSATPIIPNKTTGVMAALTPANWNVRVTAR